MRDSSLGLVLAVLYPLLHQSLNWFKAVQGVLAGERMGSEVRLSDLETGMSSSGNIVGAETDIAISVPSSSQPSVSQPSRFFHALKEEYSLNEETLSRFRDRFQFLEETRIRLPCSGKKSCAFAHGEVCFYEATFLCGLRFPVHPFIMELLHYLNIAPRQLTPNIWRIDISCMEIWTIVTDGDIIRLDVFVHMYRLKESKEFGYYELVPWDRRSRLIVNLHSSFHYWKSRYFFMPGDDWETLSNDF